jgi:hypothetical protein
MTGATARKRALRISHAKVRYIRWCNRVRISLLSSISHSHPTSAEHGNAEYCKRSCSHHGREQRDLRNHGTPVGRRRCKGRSRSQVQRSARFLSEDIRAAGGSAIGFKIEVTERDHQRRTHHQTPRRSWDSKSSRCRIAWQQARSRILSWLYGPPLHAPGARPCSRAQPASPLPSSASFARDAP